jgi:hypothetical protein
MAHLDLTVVANKDAAINADPFFINDPYAQGHEDPFHGANRALADDNDGIDENNVDDASGPIPKKRGNKIWFGLRKETIFSCKLVLSKMCSYLTKSQLLRKV